MAPDRQVAEKRKRSCSSSISPDGEPKDNTSLRYFGEYFFTMATPAKMMAIATSSRGPNGSR